MESAIAKAVTLFLGSPETDDEQIRSALTEGGVGRKLATGLVVFVPMAYCRVLLEHTGVRFSGTFQRYLKDGAISAEMPLESELIWINALDFARRDTSTAISRNDKLRVAARSAEFRAVNELMNQGSKLKNIGFTPSLLMWSEEDDFDEVPQPSRSRWWQVRR